MDEGTPLGGLESEDDAKPSHGLHTVFSSLWGRGYLAHILRIRFPEDKGVRRPKQPDQLRGLTRPTGRGSGHGLTTLGTVSTVSTTLLGLETSRAEPGSAWLGEARWNSEPSQARLGHLASSVTRLGSARYRLASLYTQVLNNSKYSH
jgi:hypothetical protein